MTTTIEEKQTVTAGADSSPRCARATGSVKWANVCRYCSGEHQTHELAHYDGGSCEQCMADLEHEERRLGIVPEWK